MEELATKPKHMPSFRHLLTNCSDFFDKAVFFQCIRESLMMLIPVIMVGAFALVMMSFPIEGYSELLQKVAGGLFYKLLQYLYQASFGMMSVYMTVSLALCFSNHICRSRGNRFGAVFTALFAFILYSGVLTDSDLSVLSVNGMFTAMVCGFTASALYHLLDEKLRFRKLYYTDGADDNFQNMVRSILPMFGTMLIFTIIHLFIAFVLQQDNFQDLYVALIGSLFRNLGRNTGTSILYILVIHFLWFFGIHGSNVLETVSQSVFIPALEQNVQMAAAGQQPTEIYSKAFFDVFVLMGGCGSTICLLIAILLFSRKKGTRSLAALAIFPGIFNVNELVLFGLPIVFNPIYIIPFFLTPFVAFLTSMLAMQTGIVPIVMNGVEWTTPILFGGYYSTGSLTGSLLQFVNLVLGVMIYKPFVAIADHSFSQDGRKKINRLVAILQESEKSRIPVALLDMAGEPGITAKNLAEDLGSKVGKELPTLFYQPQYNHKGKCIGAEALLRWNHPVYGMVYPPLVFQLAGERGILTELEMDVFRTVLRDLDQVLSVIGPDAEISVNVTGTTIQLDEYEDFLKRMQQMYPQYTDNIMIEITEQAALTIDEPFVERLTRIKNMGYHLGIDDFSMGNTSIKYLQTNVFSLLKLDGGLSRDILSNSRSKGIVASVSKLTKELGIRILAEYVETEEQREVLEDMGVCLYQGYLYSPAVPLDKLLQLTKPAALAQE